MGMIHMVVAFRLRPRSCVARTPLRGCDFFVCDPLRMRGISEGMSEADSVAGQEAQEAKPEVRLRRAERRQIAMVVQCPDDLVGPSHAVRMVMAVVEKLDVSGFF